MSKSSIDPMKEALRNGGSTAKQAEPKAPRGNRATAHRVEAVNALALANKETVGELQAVLTNAIDAQRSVAKQTAQVFESLMSGEFLHQQIQAELAQIEQAKGPLKVEFETFGPIALLGSGGRELVKALPSN
jgi:hypothetical protein